MSVKFTQIQSIVYKPSGKPYGRHLLLNFLHQEGAKEFISEIKSMITTADEMDEDKIPETVLNLSLTYEGLKALGMSTNLLEGFPDAYKTPERLDIRRTTGDIDDNGPGRWWGGNFSSSEVHCILHIFASSTDAIDALVSTVRNIGVERGITEKVPSIGQREPQPIDVHWPYGKRTVHFGFKDGLSQPRISWVSPPLSAGADEQPYVDYKEFLLGYKENESLSDDLKGIFKNSTYGAFRWMTQDVSEFEQFLDRHAQEAARAHPNSNATHEDLKEWVDAKMFGRWRDGTPMTLSDEKPDSALANKYFTYKNTDLNGRKCPITSHIRLANPRDQGEFRVGALGEFEEVPQLIRRGAPFGPKWDKENPDDEPRGLAGLFLTGNLRAFELIMNWVQDAGFSNLFEGDEEGKNMQDPIVGNRINANNKFKFRAKRRVEMGPLPKFVSTIGALNVLFPSISYIDSFKQKKK